jgi:hypothetical protein
MEDVYGIEECFNILRLILLLDRPNNVKDIRFMYNVKEEDVEDRIIAAYVNIWVKTLDDSFILDVLCDADNYEDKSRDEAEDNLQFHTYETLQRWIDDKEYEYFWGAIDFEKKDWKRKGG